MAPKVPDSVEELHAAGNQNFCNVQKKWNSLPSENHKETTKNKSKETTTAKGRAPSAGDVERAKVLKEEGNELVKKGNHESY
ncbi:hypothetical protein HispidOSU_027396 [Sigmodon hispidus]